MAIGVCGFDNTDVLLGRPLGGRAVLWRKIVDAQVTVVDAGSKRMRALRISSPAANPLLIAVYACLMRIVVRIVVILRNFLSLLSSIDYLNCQHQDCFVIVGGYFNVDFVRDSYHTSLLSKFCKDRDLQSAVSHSVHCVDCTHHFNMSRFSVGCMAQW